MLSRTRCASSGLTYLFPFITADTVATETDAWCATSLMVAERSADIAIEFPHPFHDSPERSLSTKKRNVVLKLPYRVLSVKQHRSPEGLFLSPLPLPWQRPCWRSHV